MQISQRIDAFSVLANNLESFVQHFHQDSQSPSQLEFNQKIQLAKAKNGWFDIQNQLFAIDSWAKALQKDSLEKWLNAYQLKTENPKTIGIVTAGNIPMVGFHDILSVIMTGNIAQIKLSSNDNVLIPYILNFISEIEPALQEQFNFVDKLENYDAVIATGSDNTARYFESYFADVPHLIRKNRTSVAVLQGLESTEELKGLAQDILQYYGMGCRNVTKLFLPKNYDLNLIFEPLYAWKDVINHHKYANNYDYHKAIYMMKEEPLLENGFLLMKEDEGLFSPISVVFYEYYESLNQVEEKLNANQEKIQCIIGKEANQIPFGKAQNPQLWDYADNVDTVKWLLNL